MPNAKQFPVRSGPLSAYRNWSDEAMEKVITAVGQKGSVFVKLQKWMQYHDLTGRIEHGALPGSKPYLTKDEEEELVRNATINTSKEHYNYY